MAQIKIKEGITIPEEYAEQAGLIKCHCCLLYFEKDSFVGRRKGVCSLCNFEMDMDKETMAIRELEFDSDNYDDWNESYWGDDCCIDDLE